MECWPGARLEKKSVERKFAPHALRSFSVIQRVFLLATVPRMLVSQLIYFGFSVILRFVSETSKMALFVKILLQLQNLYKSMLLQRHALTEA